MPDKRSSKIGHSRFGTTVIAILPEATIQAAHVFRFSGNDADRHTTANDFSIRSKIGTNAKMLLSSAESDSQSGDHFVKDQSGWLILSKLSQLLHKFSRLEFRHAALDRLDQNSSDLVHPLANDLQRLLCSVIENQSVPNVIGRNTGRCGKALKFFAAASNHFVQDSVIVAVEHDDQIATRCVASKSRAT